MELLRQPDSHNYLTKKTINLFKAVCFVLLFMTTIQIECRDSCCGAPGQGATGVQGPQGSTRPQGPQGAAGPAYTETFASIFLVSVQTVAPQAALLFDSVSTLEGNISYNASTGEITLVDAGYYRIRYGVTATSNNSQVALQLNGSIVSGSTMDTQNSIMQGIGVIFQATSAMSILKLINNETVANTTFSTSNPSSINAYLVIQSL